MAANMAAVFPFYHKFVFRPASNTNKVSKHMFQGTGNDNLQSPKLKVYKIQDGDQNGHPFILLIGLKLM